MNRYQFRVTNHTGNGYTIDIYARSLPTAIRKTMRGMIRSTNPAPYIEHIDGRLNPFVEPHIWNVVHRGDTFGTIELLETQP